MSAAVEAEAPSPTRADVLAEALACLRAGISVMPIGAHKVPIGEWHHLQVEAMNEAEARRAFARATGVGVICGAVSGGLEMLEFEGRAVEDGTLDAFYAEMESRGASGLVERLWDGWSESTPSGGLHLYYRSPVVEGNTKLARTERQPAPTPTRPDLKRRKELIETRGEGGFSVIAPSFGTVHDTGEPWQRISGGPATVATLAEAERALLFDACRCFDRPDPEEEQATSSTVVDITDARDASPIYLDLDIGGSWITDVIEDFNRRTSWADVLAGEFVQLDTRDGVTRWHYEGADNRVSATTNATGRDSLIVFSGTAEGAGWAIHTGTGKAPSYDKFSAHVRITTGRDDTEARTEVARRLRTQGYGPAERSPNNGLSTIVDSPTPTSEAPADDPGQHLPAEFFDARPELDHIRRAAWCRRIAPDALLHVVLARVAVLCPHTLELDAGISSPVGLSYLAAIVAGAGAGKSSALAGGRDLLPSPAGFADMQPIGSGEGLIEGFFGMVDEEGPGGKTVKVKRQVRHAQFVAIDEGQVLADLGQRSGSTLLPTLRTAYTHGTLGQLNASAERRRQVDAYVLGVVMALQAAKAGPLLADANAGTPQRFVWASALDPTAPDDPPAWPGSLDWSPPSVADLAGIRVQRRGFAHHPLTIATTIGDELARARLATLRGGVVLDEFDAHAGMVKLKIAALLALLAGRLEVTAEDWQLAGVALDASTAVRKGVQAAVAAVARVEESARTDAHVRRAMAVESTAESKALASSAKSITTVVSNHAKSDAHDGKPCTRRCVTLAMASKYRQLVTVDDVVARAVADGTIVPDGQGWRPGRGLR